MTTRYNHRVTMICPEHLMQAANQLALIAGESSADDKTFTSTSHEDTYGNKYAICSAVVTEGFLQIQSGLPAELPPHAENADILLAQQALDALAIYAEGGLLSSDALTMAVDVSPKTVIENLRLTILEVNWPQEEVL